METESVLAQKRFDGLLQWLDPDYCRAGQAYENIRRSLIKIFVCRGCDTPEDLADTTIDRVALKLPIIAASYTGEPALYFYGVAKRIYYEYRRRKPARLLPNTTSDQPDDTYELYYRCLEEGLDDLEPEDRSLVLEYYLEDGQARIIHRRRMAVRLGIAGPTLRVRAHRIRAGLERYVRARINSMAEELRLPLPDQWES